MISIEEFSSLALSFPEATAEPHFEKNSFRIRKKIFATLDGSKHEAVLKLIPEQQIEFCDIEGKIIYPVKGKWGEKGWTAVNLALVHSDLLKDAISQAFRNVAPAKLSADI